MGLQLVSSVSRSLLPIAAARSNPTFLLQRLARLGPARPDKAHPNRLRIAKWRQVRRKLAFELSPPTGHVQHHLARLFPVARAEIERTLERQQARSAASHVINRIMQNVKTPPRSPSPDERYATEADRFERANARLHYDYVSVRELD